MSKTIGHYEIVGELGRGGMGVVYKAHEQSLGRYVAIKMLGDQVVNDATIRARFMREARSAASLNHPNIIQIYFVGEDQGRPFFAMEYVSGVSLAQVIRSEHQLEPQRAAGILLQAASGLARAHDQGIIHRDIKPGNIMIDLHGHVKLADFGIAYVADVTEKLTATGQFLGTPGYLSPEVCLGKPVEAPADIFSLGIVYFEMLTGKTPFRADSPLSMLREVVETEVPDPRSLNQNVDLDSQLILAKMVAKDPKQRYPNCHELVADLKRYVRGDVQPVIPSAAMLVAGSPTPIAPPRPDQASLDAPTAPLTRPAEPGAELGVTEVITPAGAQAGSAAQTANTELITPPGSQARAAGTEAVMPPPLPPPEPEPTRMRTGEGPAVPMTPKAKTSKMVPILLAAMVVGAIALGAWWMNRPEETKTADLTEKDGPGEPSPNLLGGAGDTEHATPEHDTDGQEDGVNGDHGDLAALRDPANDHKLPANSFTSGDSGSASPQVAGPASAEDPTNENEASPDSDKVVAGKSKTATPGPSTEDTKVNLIQGQTKTARVGIAPPNPEPPGVVLVPNSPKLALVASGDPLLAKPLRHHLQTLLADEGYAVLDEDAVGIFPRADERPNPRTMGDTAAARGGDILVLAQVDYLESRELNYLGRNTTLHKAEVTFKCWFPDGDRTLGANHRTVVEYTSINAEQKGEKAALDAIDLLIANMKR